MAYLGTSETTRLKILREGAGLKVIVSEHQADEIACALHSEMPWMGPATGESAGFSVSGNQRGWASAGPGKPLEAILTSRVANPVVVVDEVDKAGAVTLSKGVPYQMTNALLSLLEPSTVGQWPCLFFRGKLDMSWITWVLTANSLEGLPIPS